MKSKVWFRKALTMCLMVAIYATYSNLVLAGTDKIVGELTVSGKTASVESPAVKVNGEAVQSGRAIFSNSTIATSESSTAVVNVGKAGKIELAPGTTISLSFDEKGLSGDLVTGTVTALSANNVSIKLPNGNVTKLNAGESATSNPAQTTTSGGGGAAWWIFALVLGGAAAGIILAATSDDNDIQLGGGTTVVSPTR